MGLQELRWAQNHHPESVNKPLEIQNIPVKLPPIPAPREQDEPLLLLLHHLLKNPSIPAPTLSHKSLKLSLTSTPDTPGRTSSRFQWYKRQCWVADTATLKEHETRAAGHVVGLVFLAGEYPKAVVVVKKRKAKAVEELERGNKWPKIKYKSVKRVFMGGKDYFNLALVGIFYPDSWARAHISMTSSDLSFSESGWRREKEDSPVYATLIYEYPGLAWNIS